MSDTIKNHSDFTLPDSVISKLDVSRLVGELERIDNELSSRKLRGDNGDTEIAQSMQLTEFLERNELSLTESENRSHYIKELRTLKNKVPVIHMTFSVPADPESLAAMARWLRESVHPHAVIAAGLQPALIAGVYMRTTNHVHDFSLRSLLSGGHDILKKELETLRG